MFAQLGQSVEQTGPDAFPHRTQVSTSAFFNSSKLFVRFNSTVFFTNPVLHGGNPNLFFFGHGSWSQLPHRTQREVSFRLMIFGKVQYAGTSLPVTGGSGTQTLVHMLKSPLCTKLFIFEIE